MELNINLSKSDFTLKELRDYLIHLLFVTNKANIGIKKGNKVTEVMNYYFNTAFTGLTHSVQEWEEIEKEDPELYHILVLSDELAVMLEDSEVYNDPLTPKTIENFKEGLKEVEVCIIKYLAKLEVVK